MRREETQPPPDFVGSAVVGASPELGAALLQAGLQEASRGLEQHPCNVAAGTSTESPRGGGPRAPSLEKEELKGSATVSIATND